jgi:hypothetical protein
MPEQQEFMLIRLVSRFTFITILNYVTAPVTAAYLVKIRIDLICEVCVAWKPLLLGFCG